ncbi:amidohydrolase family protein [Marinimicrobium sp. ABcell2]|uniref:amidohydrolase family protein n=1 Tax=Marinimicrobium sp. ABcell2 TaxID=3069751 RepID=UPI0027ADC3D1|nr:amidohydrolase family protein [Marinimicrobium sp. ABcell2]MDQ2075841.1 amidohydrolase family protein [Marinimicrobium sp. ABcell2]
MPKIQSFKLIKILAVAVSSLLLIACNSAQRVEPGLYVFENVNVIPMDRERVLRNQSVIVRDGRIQTIQPVGLDHPEGATVIEGSNRYLMPGLAEMHGHVPGDENPQYTEDVLFLYISNGVTLVRGMAGNPYHVELREKLASGELDGPTLYAAGPWLGPHNAGSEEQVRNTVREHHQIGFDLLKVGNLPAEQYPPMVEEAQRVGIPFGGHIPSRVPLEQALDAGQASIDHLDRYVEFLAAENVDLTETETGFFGSALVDHVDMDRLQEAVELTVEAGTWNVPTLSLVEHLASEEPAESMAEWPEMRYLPRDVIDNWVEAKRNFQEREYFQPEAARRLVQIRQDILMALHDGGAPIALGSDAPQFFNVPGFSIHHEMAMMVAAGMTPYEVLVTGTRNVAHYFDAEGEFGRVEPGYRADLILLEANPLDDIGLVRQRAGVMVRGQWFSEREIQDRLEEIGAR